MLGKDALDLSKLSNISDGFNLEDLEINYTKALTYLISKGEAAYRRIKLRPFHASKSLYRSNSQNSLIEKSNKLFDTKFNKNDLNRAKKHILFSKQTRQLHKEISKKLKSGKWVLNNKSDIEMFDN